MRLNHEFMTTNSPWMTTEAVAEYLDVPVHTVRAWRYRGVGPAGHRVGRHVRYHRDEVDRWVLEGDDCRPTAAAI